ncbi:CU044_5270 family protein [Hamadaea tsunoensis]|uniref:CU044_5270 family protein n=1 Tax=Hamadaea tsunoensis TaxID=53368 RepID=UPI00040397D1|nr:CU044_5270 family protein [Hamadaea tsunoensis]
MSTHRDTLRTLTEARPARLTADTQPADPTALMAYPRETAARRTPPVRRLAFAGGALAAVAAVGVAVATLPANSPHAPTAANSASSPAAAQPKTASDWLLVAAESSVTATAHTGRYWVFRTEVGEADHPALTIEQWLATVNGAPSAGYFWDATQNKWTRRDMQGHTAKNNFLLAGQGRSAAAIAALPTQPDQLKAKLLAWEGERLEGDQAQYLFYAAAALVLDLPATPEVRSAAYRMLAGVPGITNLGIVTDATGRSGLGVAIRHRGDFGSAGETRLIIDPATGVALAQESWTNGVRSSYTALLASSWSDGNLPAATEIH